MTVEITGYTFKDGIVTLEAENCDELNLQRMERIRDDYLQRQIEFIFDLHQKTDFQYLRNFLKRQKRIREVNPSTWGEALRAVTGTVVSISGKYLNRAA